jgi:hypothetical protein
MNSERFVTKLYIWLPATVCNDTGDLGGLSFPTENALADQIN